MSQQADHPSSRKTYTFADMAVAMLELGSREAMEIEQAEILVAQLHNSPGVSHALDAMRERAAIIRAAHLFFREASKSENDVARALDTLDAPAPFRKFTIPFTGRRDRRATAVVGRHRRLIEF